MFGAKVTIASVNNRITLAANNLVERSTMTKTSEIAYVGCICELNYTLHSVSDCFARGHTFE